MAQTATARTVRLEVPAKPDFVVLARLALSAVCRLTPLEPDDVADLKLAITEAAAAFVGEGDSEAARLDSAAAGQDEDGEARGPGTGSLDFVFVLGEDRLELEIASDGGITISDDERELGRAIIEATVDECEYREDVMRLVKYLRAAG